GQDRLAAANAVVQATTITAILAGVFAFSVLFEEFLGGVLYSSESQLLQAIAPIGWVLIGCSLIELALAYRLPTLAARRETARFDPADYLRGRYLRNNLKSLFENRIIWLSIVGLSLFWAISQVVLAAFPAFAKETLLETNTVVVQGLLACSGIGIIFGSLLAGRASAAYIETGLLPLAAAGITVCIGILPALDAALPIGLVFLLLGVFGGLFVIPLNALIQFHAREARLGTVLAGNNWVQNITMLGFLGLTVGFSLAGLDSVGLFYLLTTVALGGAIYTLYRLPQSLVRYLVSFLFSRRYRIHVLGFNNIPAQGPVLLLVNHISWIDWAILQIAFPRPIRFVMHRHYYQRWYLKRFLDFFGVVPIGQGQSKEALGRINALLKAGEVVCLFPEGSISRTGHLGEFQRGYEHAVEGVEGVIVPFYLHGLWGSRFSRAGQRLRDQRIGLKRNLTVAFGEPLPLQTRAPALKQRVFELSARAWEHRARRMEPLALAWLRTAKRRTGSLCLIDAQGASLSAERAVTGAIVLGRFIAKNSPEQNVGMLLPASSAGVLANLGVLLRGKTVVNLNYTASIASLEAAVKKAELKSLYTSRRFLEKLAQRGLDLSPIVSKLDVIYLEDLREQTPALTKLAILLLVKVLPARALYGLFGRRVDIETPAAILFSSGSEGEPKGVVLSHKNLLSNVNQIIEVLDTRENDVMVGALPLFHAFGLTATGFMPLIAGIPLICHPDPTDVLTVAKAIAKHRGTILCGTSTFLRLYVKNQRVHPLMLESLRLVIAGAEKLNQDVRESFKLKFNKEVYEGYGATETAPVASTNLPDRIDPNTWRVQPGAKPGTVGMPLPGTRFRIVDPQTLAELPIGEEGLILIAGPQVMQGYLNDPDKTMDALVEIDGLVWYKTGDKGRLDEDGFLTIVDRYSRFAKIGGEMVSLGAVEEQLRRVVTEGEPDLVAVNLPDGKKGEKIVVLVAGGIDARPLRERLIASGCNPLMIPAALYPLPEIPRLGSGKTDFNTA
ncbi:MAG: acyl-[ACP]--phospholipid O-acyltransferase, partial [Candidatus Competibacterales bacterium]|nr:acyl-[ACP]--phospholipid O-acyltransferase [Candidatus Competibacterales bacterium]